MQIRADPSVFYIVEPGTVWASIYVEHDGVAFPEKNWDDIAFGVLSEWGDACLGVIEDEGSPQKFSFLDGPVFFSCVRRGDNLHVEWIHEGIVPSVVLRFTSSVTEFLTSYISAFDQLYETYSKLDRTTYNPGSEQLSLELCHYARSRIAAYLQLGESVTNE